MRLIARATPVFCAEQVDGYDAPSTDHLNAGIEFCELAERFISTTGADIHHGYQEAFYEPALDRICLPAREKFIGTATSTPAESYYSTLIHELTHWTGAINRCNRNLSGRFGSEAYAMEELVAELGAAFLCAQFGVSAIPREDHAHYLSHWLAALKADKRAIFIASSKASQAVSLLTERTVL